MKAEAYDIIITAGQSNAQGTGAGPAEQEYIPTEHIMMLTDEGNPRFETAEDGTTHFVMDYPTPMGISVAQELVVDGQKRGQLQLSFAREYYRRYLQGTGRKVLLLQCGVGGTGFCRNEWGCQGAILFDRLVRMTQYALSLNPDNRLVALLWHQGECDSFENPDWTPETRYATHKEKLTAMLDAFCQQFSCPELPVIAGGFCDEWYEKFKAPCDAVLAAIRETVLSRNGAFIDTSGLMSNNQQIGNGDDIHFSRESLSRLGKLYFDAYSRLIQ